MTGRPDRNDESESERFRIAEVSIHKEYLRKRHHDIAVARPSRDDPAPAVLLPTKAEDAIETAPGNELRVAGWGGTTPQRRAFLGRLLDVALFTISDAECSTHFSFFRPKEEVCAFGEEVAPDRYNDSCYGDSGGPLVSDAPRGALLVGIVSYGGFRCGSRNQASTPKSPTTWDSSSARPNCRSERPGRPGSSRSRTQDERRSEFAYAQMSKGLVRGRRACADPGRPERERRDSNPRPPA